MNINVEDAPITNPDPVGNQGGRMYVTPNQEIVWVMTPYEAADHARWIRENLHQDDRAIGIPEALEAAANLFAGYPHFAPLSGKKVYWPVK